mgnify:CR=1 FL=1
MSAYFPAVLALPPPPFAEDFLKAIKFQLFLFNRQVSEQALAEQFDIPLQEDDFDDIRDEYTHMLKHQSAKGNNGIIKSKYLIFGVESAGYREAKSKLSNIEKLIFLRFWLCRPRLLLRIF